MIKYLEFGYVLRFSPIAESGPSLKSNKQTYKKTPTKTPQTCCLFTQGDKDFDQI